MKAQDCSGGMWIAQQRGAFTEKRFPDYGKLRAEEKKLGDEKQKPHPGDSGGHGSRKATV